MLYLYKNTGPHILLRFVTSSRDCCWIEVRINNIIVSKFTKTFLFSGLFSLFWEETDDLSVTQDMW